MIGSGSSPLNDKFTPCGLRLPWVTTMQAIDVSAFIIQTDSGWQDSRMLMQVYIDTHYMEVGLKEHLHYITKRLATAGLFWSDYHARYCETCQVDTESNQEYNTRVESEISSQI